MKILETYAQRLNNVDSSETSASLPERARNRTPYAQKEIQTLGKSLSKLGKHLIVLLAVVALAVLMHFLLVRVFGDPKFFDLIPVRYVIDLGDASIILTFVIIIIRELWTLDE